MEKLFKVMLLSGAGIILLIIMLYLFSGCSAGRKLSDIKEKNIRASVSMGTDEKSIRLDAAAANDVSGAEKNTVSDTVRDSSEPLIMNAVVEESTGDYIASDVIKPVLVQARFRNVAERNGKVSISFQIAVPSVLQDPSWQVRLFPKLVWNSDSMRLEKILITGKDYRNSQLKGYAKYRKYCSSIISDTADFVKYFTREALLRRFSERNLYGKGTQSSFGITENDAVDYYTKAWLVSGNNRRKSRLEEVYKKFVKDPLDKEGVRLDTVVISDNGDIEFTYTQTFKAMKGMKKILLSVAGGIFAEGKRVYSLPDSDSLSYYISSVDKFAITEPHFLEKIIERRMTLSTVAFIDFRAGEWAIDDTLYNNENEIARISGNLDTVCANSIYIIDSIRVTASCSPEGTFLSNTYLAERRAKSVRNYFSGCAGKGVFKSWYIPEDWETLERLVKSDSAVLDKTAVMESFKITDPDKREKVLAQLSDYKYIRSTLYPLLRRIKFNFFLQRKGMVKDTIHTRELDTLYMNGVLALCNKEYKKAIEILRPYRDINAAVAYLSLNYNHSALDILDSLKASAARNYMLAIVHGRLGNERKSIEYFKSSVLMDPMMKYRGKLDPEIALLIEKYNLLK